MERQLQVQAWNSATRSWVSVKQIGDASKVLPIRTVVQFADVTSSRIRIDPVAALAEVEVFENADASQQH